MNPTSCQRKAGPLTVPRHRFFHLALGIFAILSSDGVGAAEVSGGFTYEVTGSGAIVVEFAKDWVGPVVIPDLLGGQAVTEIGWEAFIDCASITSVTLPASVNRIVSNAFDGCWALQDFSVHSSNPIYRSVDGVIFEGSTLFLFPRNKGGNYAIPDGTVSTDSRAFWDCRSLVTLRLPSSLINFSIDGCTSLVSITVQEGNLSFRSTDGVLFKKAFGEVGTTFGELFRYPEGRGGRYSIPAGTRSVGGGAFRGCFNLTDVEFPSSVDSLTYSSFAECHSLTEVFIPSTLTRLVGGAFRGCRRLQQIKVSESNPNYSSVDGILFSKDKKFLTCYPAGKSSDYAIPNGVENVGSEAFAGNEKLCSVVFPPSVFRIGTFAFADCTRLRHIDLPDSLSMIADWAFAGSGLIRVTLPDSLSSLNYDAFGDCPDLQTLVVGRGLSYFGATAIYGCPQFKSLIFKGNAPAISGTLKEFTQSLWKSYVFEGATGFTTPVWQGHELIVVRESEFPFSRWLADSGYAPDTDMLSESTENGISLLMTYALGGDPSRGNAMLMPEAAVTDGKLRLSFRGIQPLVNYRVETSTDLHFWSTENVIQSQPDLNGIVIGESTGAGTPRFLRLAVTPK